MDLVPPPSRQRSIGYMGHYMKVWRGMGKKNTGMHQEGTYEVRLGQVEGAKEEPSSLMNRLSGRTEVAYE
jgi:hypothetical protein